MSNNNYGPLYANLNSTVLTSNCIPLYCHGVNYIRFEVQLTAKHWLHCWTLHLYLIITIITSNGLPELSKQVFFVRKWHVTALVMYYRCLNTVPGRLWYTCDKTLFFSYQKGYVMFLKAKHFEPGYISKLVLLYW